MHLLNLRSTVLTSSNDTASRVKFALHHPQWSYESGSRNLLQVEGTKILVSDYLPHMDGKLFCPVCCTNLTRMPKNKAVFSNGRKSCFAHLPTYSNIQCNLRSKKPEGQKYLNEEEAREAIEDNKLVVISAFLESSPETAGLVGGTYDQSAIEDLNGPVTEIAIGRHFGDRFLVPTTLTTVNGICRNFDSNLYKHYIFPGSQAALRLIDVLVDLTSVEDVVSIPRLYFGRIISTRNAGINPKPTNLRMTWLEHHPSVKDFCLKDIDANQLAKGINDDSAGRIVVFWGTITESGIGLCINKPSWGEYALLPSKYDDLLPLHAEV